MSTLTDKLPTLPTVKLPDVKLPEVLDLDEAKKPAFAAVGVVDLYVEQVKEFPADAKKLQAELTAKFEAARYARSARLKAVPAQLKSLPATTTESAKNGGSPTSDSYTTQASDQRSVRWSSAFEPRNCSGLM